MLHIESLVAGIDDQELTHIMYDETYLRANVRFFDAQVIPHFGEFAPDGVFNAEYDSSLMNIEDVSIENIIQWIEGV